MGEEIQEKGKWEKSALEMQEKDFFWFYFLNNEEAVGEEENWIFFGG